jgi:hypothetical protein
LSPPTPESTVGASGGPTGVTVAFNDCCDDPILFVAVTRNVYVVPFSNPEIVMGEEDPGTVMVPDVDLTMYPVIGDPPSFTGAVKDTVA